MGYLYLFSVVYAARLALVVSRSRVSDQLHDAAPMRCAAMQRERLPAGRRDCAYDNNEFQFPAEQQSSGSGRIFAQTERVVSAVTAPV